MSKNNKIDDLEIGPYLLNTRSVPSKNEITAKYYDFVCFTDFVVNFFREKQGLASFADFIQTYSVREGNDLYISHTNLIFFLNHQRTTKIACLLAGLHKLIPMKKIVRYNLEPNQVFALDQGGAVAEEDATIEEKIEYQRKVFSGALRVLFGKAKWRLRHKIKNLEI